MTRVIATTTTILGDAYLTITLYIIFIIASQSANRVNSFSLLIGKGFTSRVGVPYGHHRSSSTSIIVRNNYNKKNNINNSNNNNQRLTALLFGLPPPFSVSKNPIHRSFLSSSLSATMNSNDNNNIPKSVTKTPPMAKRDSTLYVPAGKLDPQVHTHLFGEKEKKQPLLRQSNPQNPLLDPAIHIPDPYGWMRDESRTNTDILNHLEDENTYTKACTEHLQSLQKELYDEFLSSIQETDHSVPTPRGGGSSYVYYTRTMEGKSYTIYCRAPREEENNNYNQNYSWDGTPSQPIVEGEQVYLDVNELAKDRTYCSMGTVSVSPQENLVGYTVDYTGGEVCQLMVQDLNSGNMIMEDTEIGCYGTLVWGKDERTLFYLKVDDAKRPYQLYRRQILDDDDHNWKDELLWEETDELYWMHVYKTLDEKYLILRSASKETSEVWYLDLHSNDDDDAKLKCIAPRRKKVLYRVSHWEGTWFISTNAGNTPNLKLMSCPVGGSHEDWTPVIWKKQNDDDVVDDDDDDDDDNDSTSREILFDGGYDRSLDAILTFKNHAVASGREEGIPRIWILSLSKDTNQNGDDQVHVRSFTRLNFEEDAYDVGLASNREYDTDTVRVAYDSLVTPLQHLEISLTNPSSPRTVLKEKKVPGYNKEDYGCDRITVPSRDGTTEIPCSLVYRKDIMEEWISVNNDSDDISASKSLPVHLYGYGSYGSCIEASFRSTRLSLLDRGIVYVIAHVRGGGEMGRQWYEEPNGAKYLCKKNTFFDFVDVAHWLVHTQKLTTPDQLSCEGRSAGGLLIGASINLAPELFKAAILGVPFVDVVCTMVDSTIPLTVVEWEEWGNPNEKKYFDYMMEYSPINNVKADVKYPACLLTGGLHDPRVQYWEPSKFAAELRHKISPDSGPICLKMDMTAGHFSASDRYKYYRELSFDYSFLLDQLNLSNFPYKKE